MIIDDPTLAKAMHALELRRPELALELLGAAAGELTEGAAFWLIRGRAHQLLEQPHAALSDCHEGLRRVPDSIALLHLLSLSHKDVDDLAAAERAVLAAIALDPSDGELFATYADLCGLAGQFQKAEALLDRALALAPDSLDVHKTAVVLAWLSCDNAVLAARTGALLAEQPNDQLGHAMLGMRAMERGQAGASLDALSTAVRQDPRNLAVADIATEARVRSHWLMLPLRPLYRWGAVPLWLGSLLIIVVLGALEATAALTAVALVYLFFCLYSWTVPFAVRRWLTQR